MKRRRKVPPEAPETKTPRRENRWCEKHGYCIDLEACMARSADRPQCRRCLMRWRQLSLPLWAVAVSCNFEQFLFKVDVCQRLRLNSSGISGRLHSADCPGFIIGSLTYSPYDRLASSLPPCDPNEMRRDLHVSFDFVEGYWHSGQCTTNALFIHHFARMSTVHAIPVLSFCSIVYFSWWRLTASGACLLIFMQFGVLCASLKSNPEQKPDVFFSLTSKKTWLSFTSLLVWSCPINLLFS